MIELVEDLGACALLSLCVGESSVLLSSSGLLVAMASAPRGILITLSCPQLHPESARGVDAAEGLSEAAAGQQGTF